MNVKYGYLFFLLFFIMVFASLGCSSAYYSTTYSSSGKTITVNKVNSASGLHISVHMVNGDAVSALESGKDTKGRTYNRTTTLTKDTLKITGSKGFYWYSIANKKSSTLTTETITGKFDSSKTFKGSSTYTTDIWNGRYVLKKRTTTLNFYKNGVYHAKMVITTTPTYDYLLGSWNLMKWAESFKTNYADGSYRSSTITQTFKRNEIGIATGLSISGTSSGRDLINSKWAYYTGKITVKTVFDSRDGWGDDDYKEVKTSSSATLKKQLPFESLLFDRYIQYRGPLNLFPDYSNFP